MFQRSKTRAVVSSTALIGLISSVLIGCGVPEPTVATIDALDGVTVASADSRTIPEIHEAAGTVRSTTTSTLSSKVMGNVVGIHARVGEQVSKGQLLIEIASSDLAASVAQARSGVQGAEHMFEAARSGVVGAEASSSLALATLERYRVLRERGSVSPQEFEEVEARAIAAGAILESSRRSLAAAEAQRDQAVGSLALAQATLAWSRVTSPVDGVVVSRQVDAGDQARPGMPLIVVEDDSTYQVEVLVEESLIGRIEIGDEARIVVEAVGVELDGEVTEISPAVSSGRSFLVKVNIRETLPSTVRSGMFARVGFVFGHHSAVTVPSNAIVEKGQLSGAWVVDSDGRAIFRLVKTGDSLGERLEILSGLDEGEQVVVTRLDAIRDGLRVGSGS